MSKYIFITGGVMSSLGKGVTSASLAKFLLTNQSSWVTGQVIAVDGGRSKLS